MNDRRERRLENLVEATDENTKSGAIDAAADFYIKMRGETTAVPTGAIEQLMERADETGSVTAEEVAEILHTDELPVAARTTWRVGLGAEEVADR